MDLAISELPNILNAKVDIDSSIQKVNIQIGKINNMRRTVIDTFDSIDGELLREEEEKNLTDEEKEERDAQGNNGSLILVFNMLLLVFL